jgi:c(7)-type cytochrome triheme protein
MRLKYLFLLFVLHTGWIGAEETVGEGKNVAMTHCAGCHAPGVMGAPKIGVRDDWEARFDKGLETLVENAKNGFNNMPARGGNILLKDKQVHAAVEYMLKSAGFLGGLAGSGVTQAEKDSDRVAAAQDKMKAEEGKSPVQVEIAQQSSGKSMVGQANRFNRLMKTKADWNPPPWEDGIHDPDNPETALLQAPKEAFSTFKQNSFGNHVDWVDALDRGLVTPRYDLLDPDKKPIIMDLNIVREVKGSMPDVVYPHKQHTEWLDCSNCHPSIFIPQKGANALSMASILVGQQCGVCHGKVSFPVSECRRCHSKPKPRN